eukprot:15445739-Alexandrium_andersonii.AAC.1
MGTVSTGCRCTVDGGEPRQKEEEGAARRAEPAGGAEGDALLAGLACASASAPGAPAVGLGGGAVVLWQVRHATCQLASGPLPQLRGAEAAAGPRAQA